MRKPTQRARRLRREPTKAERVLWRHLRDRQLDGIKFRRQDPVGPYVVDFLCSSHALIVELDGGQHAEQHERDAVRTRYLEGAGYRVVRFWNPDVLRNPEGVVAEIRRILHQG